MRLGKVDRFSHHVVRASPLRRSFRHTSPARAPRFIAKAILREGNIDIIGLLSSLISPSTRIAIHLLRIQVIHFAIGFSRSLIDFLLLCLPSKIDQLLLLLVPIGLAVLASNSIVSNGCNIVHN